MKNIAHILFVLLACALWSTPMSASAADCANKAQQFASKEGAELLSVTDLGGDKCEVTLRIPGKDGKPPRVVSKKING